MTWKQNIKFFTEYVQSALSPLHLAAEVKDCHLSPWFNMEKCVWFSVSSRHTHSLLS